MEFTCRFIHNWDYTKALYLVTRRQNWNILCLWAVLAAVCAGMAVYSWRQGAFSSRGVFYIVLLLFALLRGFGGIIRVRLQWKQNCKRWGKEQIETVFTLGEEIRVSEDTGASGEISWSQIALLQKMGRFLTLQLKTGGKQKSFIYLPRDGFADGTGEEFLSWLIWKHPEVPVK